MGEVLHNIRVFVVGFSLHVVVIVVLIDIITTVGGFVDSFFTVGGCSSSSFIRNCGDDFVVCGTLHVDHWVEGGAGHWMQPL